MEVILFRKIVDLKKDVAVVDIGTNTVCAAVVRGQSSNSEDELGIGCNLRVLGVSYQLAKGIKRNSITDMDEFEETLIGTILAAGKEAKKPVKSVFVALPAWVLSSYVATASIDIRNLPVDSVHVKSLANFDTSKYVDNSCDVIQIFPISYSVDGIHEVMDPVGMVGDKLSAEFHIIAAQSAIVKNITYCLNQNNIDVVGFAPSTYASALSIALDNEVLSGVTIIDIGGATTSIACVYEGILLYLGAINIGSQNITNDIATALRTTKSNAERLKILYGVSIGQSIEEEPILVSRVDEYGDESMQTISKSYLDLIISSRLEEILDLAQNHILECGADKALYQRIIVTGGGSRLSGLSEFIKAKRYFSDMAVRLGKPICAAGSHDFVKTASFASAAGCAVYRLSELPHKMTACVDKSLWQRIITWFRRGV
ncbi:MAG: cell division protein FtsA [Holosporales bacterium]|nr:cell division protein FtsA [Holosporales bacterium]